VKDLLVVRALRSRQGENVPVYTSFIRGDELLQIATVDRISRSISGKLEGFQRGEIKRHVTAITHFLDSGPVIFPNAIILAFSTRVKFVRSRGKEPDGATAGGEIGTLYIPKVVHDRGAAWIVDGQQRALALSKSKNRNIVVPVVGFLADDLAEQRAQFVLLNKARPLSARLVDELLPEVDAYLPRDLATRKLPSALVDKLNRSPRSPFHALIRRASDGPEATGIVNDRALVTAIRKRIESPLGALSTFRKSTARDADTEAMYQALLDFWGAVKHAFPDAWGLAPTESRLMHSVGIEAMSSLMDSLYMRIPGEGDAREFLCRSLRALAPYCSWHRGRWPDIGKNWNELEYTSRDVRELTEQLVRLDLEVNRKAAHA
jgi:DGQHR domain-containing protein